MGSDKIPNVKLKFINIAKNIGKFIANNDKFKSQFESILLLLQRDTVKEVVKLAKEPYDQLKELINSKKQDTKESQIINHVNFIIVIEKFRE